MPLGKRAVFLALAVKASRRQSGGYRESRQDSSYKM